MNGADLDQANHEVLGEILNKPGGGEMICPLKFNSKTLDAEGGVRGCECEEKNCAFWNHWLGVCGLVAEAWLTGRKVEIRERLADRGLSE